MRTIFSLAFLALAFVLAFFLYKSIEEPIDFDSVRNTRMDAVTGKLEMIRKAQELFRDATGKFAGDFDTLRDVLNNGQLLSVKVLGDADNALGEEVLYDTTYIQLRDTFPGMGIKLDDLDVVPYTDGQARFDIEAKTIDYQSTTVPVVQVGVRQSKFMGKYADERFQRYDQTYEPNSPVYFGDLTKPTLAGSWN